MKRRKQLGRLMYTPKWGQGDVKFGEDYDALDREEKLEVLANWISELLSIRNEMIPNPKSWHHFMGQREWQGLTDEEIFKIFAGDWGLYGQGFARAIEAKLKEKNNAL